MAQIFRPATTTAIQRISGRPELLVKVFSTRDSVPLARTTIHTVPTAPQGCRDLVTSAVFRAESIVNLPFSLTLYVESLSTGLFYEIAKADLIAYGEEWRPIKPNFSLPLEPGDELQISGIGAGSPATIGVNCSVGGIEYRPSS